MTRQVPPIGSALDTHALQLLDSAHYLHPFTDHAALAREGARVIVRGDGIYIWDADGQQIIDGMSGLWCVNAGYGRTRIVQAAAEQMQTLPFYNSFFQSTNVPAVQLAARLAALAPPGFQHVFFTSSGSEANDTNVRMVRRYWELLGQPQRRVIISRHNAYHGSTLAGASLGGMAGMHAQGGLPLPDIHHIGEPNLWKQAPGTDPEAFGLQAARWLEQALADIGPERVAAFIGEPVQGAGGVVIPPASYWPEIQRICDAHGILLIADEVICGFGRLGHWFGSERFGIRPDLITFAKGVTSGYVPLGGVLVGERVARVLAAGGEFAHGFTYSGHPVACAAALENLRILEEEDLVRRVREDTGPYLAARFASLAGHPLVGHVDSCGFVAGLNLVRPDGSAFDPALGVGLLCRAQMFRNGMVMRAVGERMIIAPPLIMQPRQIDEMVARIRYCLNETQQVLAALGYV
ncbi:aspartate aminotransferase family protein [Massilia sp. TS11]|uniref:aspartate aminotransferase family protein n=1 Tax=Massilia sp. TS11 TaxID=2908003 RepID=UPI001EDBC0D1|nr:aspartate aminotransferase family protein [Massilia sp. TS11]MCG2586320.1 aspartate aminotransferase family protein [Massilia sp. TS11]